MRNAFLKAMCLLLGLAVPASTGLMVGCGGEEGGGGQQSSSSDSAESRSDGDERKSADATPQASNGKTRKGKGRVTEGGIPYDVFFDDPFAVAANDSVVVPSPTVNGPDDETPTETPQDSDAESDPPAKSDMVAWAELIPAKIVVDESKDVRNVMNNVMQSVRNYNTGYMQIQTPAAVLTALGQIAVDHAGDIRWKENAPHVRDLAKDISDTAIERGRKAYDAASITFGKLDATLSGSPPGDRPETPSNKPFGDIVEMGTLMYRLEEARDYLRQNGQDGKLGDRAEKLKHEAAILSALSQVLMDESFFYAEDPRFVDFAKTMRDAGQDCFTGVENDDFAKFDSGVKAIFRTCTDCHGQFKDQ